MDYERKFTRLLERLFTRWGYSHVEGRVYATLLLSNKPMTISELTEKTGLSRTSVSTALGKLEKDYMVEVRRKGRTKYFSPVPRFFERFLEQPRNLLEKEIIPLGEVVRNMMAGESSELKRNLLKELLAELKLLEYALLRLIEIEAEELRKTYLRGEMKDEKPFK